MAYTTINKGSDYFNTVLYTGDGSTNHPVTGVGFQPDLVWTKGRSGSYGISNNKLVDVVRGAGQTLHSNLTDSELDQSAPTGGSTISFDADGFTLGSNTNSNASGTTFVAWNWLANNTSGSSNTDGSITSTVSVNTTAGFSIVKFTSGASAGFSVGHGLGTTPSVIIQKTRNSTGGWLFCHKDMSASGITSGYLQLQTTDAFTSNANVFTNVNNSTVTQGSVISNNFEQIMYCFADVKGFSKFGSYVGNGSADGTFVYTGFKPAFVLIKKSSASGDNWHMWDSTRDTFNVVNKRLVPNDSVQEYSDFNVLDFCSNGFKLRDGSTYWNQSGGTFIYMCFAENPIVTSTKLPATAR